MAVSRIDHEDVDIGGDERLTPLQVLASNADGGSAPEASQRVLARESDIWRPLPTSLTVIDPFSHEPVVDRQQLFHLVSLARNSRRVVPSGAS